MTAPAPRIDAHLHLWDLARGGYSWLRPDHGRLYASVPADRAYAELQAHHVDAAVLVQAEDSARDTRFMLDTASAHPWVAGVVGWVRLDDPATAERQLDAWQEHPAFCGVRHLVHDDPRDDFLALPAVRTSLRRLGERGLPFDVPDAWPRHLAAVAELAAALPDLPVVVDHLAKPPFGGEGWAHWRATLAEVAARPLTVAKVSGLHVAGRTPDAAEVRRTWEVALDLFGPERLMWGSDWPMTVPGAGYAGAWATTAPLIAELTPAEQAGILGGTASRVYRLPTGIAAGDGR